MRTLRLLLLFLAVTPLGVLPKIGACRDVPQGAADPFMAAGVSYAEAADFLERLQRAVRANDAAAVAALSAFPLTVRGKAGPENAAQFEKRFASIYTAKVRSAVLKQRADALFANWRGLMIGDGEVWFAARCDGNSAATDCAEHRLLVISVNN
jgi:hypothetical protein